MLLLLTMMKAMCFFSQNCQISDLKWSSSWLTQSHTKEQSDGSAASFTDSPNHK